MNFKYRTYGLVVESEIECDNLLPGHGEPEVRVRLGPVPDRLAKPTRESAIFQNSPNGFLLKLDKVGRFYISRGEEIRVEPENEAACEKIKSYVFGSLFGVLLHQRRILPLHASAISTPNGAVLFSGPSGYGKSTLAGEFFQRGYQILSDDVCAITFGSGGPMMHPARASLFLRHDSLRRLDMPESGLAEAPLSADKRTVTLGSAFGPDSVPLHAFYALEPRPLDLVEIQRLSGFDKVDVLGRNIFRPELLTGEDAAMKYFSQISMLARSAQVSIVRRPKDVFRLTEMADLLEQEFSGAPLV